MSRAVFLDVGTMGIWGQRGGVSCTSWDVSQCTWPLPSRCQEHCPPIITTKTVSKHCHVSPGVGEGYSSPVGNHWSIYLRTKMIPSTKVPLTCEGNCQFQTRSHIKDTTLERKRKRLKDMLQATES